MSSQTQMGWVEWRSGRLLAWSSKKISASGKRQSMRRNLHLCPSAITFLHLVLQQRIKKRKKHQECVFFSRKRTVWREKNCERYSEYLSEYRVASTWHLLLVPTIVELSCFHQMELPWRIIKVKHKTFSLLTAILLYSRGKKKGFGILRRQNYENRTKA